MIDVENPGESGVNPSESNLIKPGGVGGREF